MLFPSSQICVVEESLSVFSMDFRLPDGFRPFSGGSVMVTDRYYGNLRFAVPSTLFYLPKTPADNGKRAQPRKLYGI